MSSAPQFPEMYDPIRWWAAATPERIALVDRADARRYSYAQLDALADARAAWLLRHDCGPGERVAVLAPNCVETVVLFFAALRTGAALVPLNWRLAPGELRAVLDDARPVVALHDPLLEPPPASAHPIDWHELVPTQPAHAPSQQTYAPSQQTYAPSQQTYAPSQQTHAPSQQMHASSETHASSSAEAAALVLYTSGSTGKPKGVILPRRQILFNAVATCTAWELGPDDVAPISTPFFHTGGWNVFATPLWHCGGRVVLIDRFDPATFLGVMAEERCTVALTVPTQLVMLLAAPDWGRPLPALRRFFSGGAPCPEAVSTAVRRAGYRIREGYGLTECGPNCFAISDAEAVHHPGAVGRPILFLQARLCDDSGRDVRPGDVGELWLRGPQMFAGYFNDDDATRTAVTRAGWLRTGDLARRDAHGLFYVCGRRKEMYISGGENVFPGEVEAALISCPGVTEVAVIGVADPHWGEVGHAFVVTSDAGLNEDDVLRCARGALAGYKVPRRITLLSVLPRLGSGKIDRRALLQMTIPEEA